MYKRKLNIGSKSSSSSESQWLRWGTPLLVAIVTFIVFLPALKNGFVNWDDDKNFLNNFLYRGLGWEQLKWMFTTFHTGPYQPLSWLTHGLDYFIWGMRPFGYHLTNVILHSLNAFVFCLLFTKLIVAGAGPESRCDRNRLYLSAGFAALLFSIHPLRVESVAWVTERRDVLSGLFYLLTILFYIRPHTDGVDHVSFWHRNRLPLSFFLLALLSKGMVISLPIILVILDIHPLGRLPMNPRRWFNHEFRTVWLEKTPYFALAVVFAAVGYFGQNKAGAISSYEEFGIGIRAAQVFFSGGFYVWKTFIPLNLAPIYYGPAGFVIADWQPLLGAAFLLSVTGTAFALRRLWPAFMAAWLFYLITLAPVSGIVKLSTQVAADRYTYLSCLGFAMLAGGSFWLGIRASRKLLRNAVLLTASFVVIILGGLSWRQTRIWRDSETLWRHTLTVNNDLQFVHNNLGVILSGQGKTAEAIAHYREAIRIAPGYGDAYTNIGVILFAQGKTDQAIACYLEAIRLAPGYADAYNNIGVALAASGKLGEAVKYLNYAVRIKPDYSAAHYNLGRILVLKGNLDEALRHYQEAVRLDRTAQNHNYLALVLTEQGKLNEALLHYQEALRIDPGYVEAHNNLSVLLLKLGKLDEAIMHCQVALRANPNYADARNNLAVMLKKRSAAIK